MSTSRLNDALPVLPTVAARVLKVSPKGLRWLGDNGKIRFVKTGGEPSIRLYQWSEVLRVLERRGRQRALRSKLPECAAAAAMAKAGLRQAALPFTRERALPTSAAKARAIGRNSIEVA